MTVAKDRIVPFVLGLAFGFFGIRWFMHVIYVALIVGSFFLGRHYP